MKRILRGEYVERDKEVGAFKAGGWMAFGVLFTMWVVFLLRLTIPPINRVSAGSELTYLFGEVVTGAYVAPASMASAFAVGLAFYFQKEVSKANFLVTFLAFCVCNYFLFVVVNVLLAHFEAVAGLLGGNYLRLQYFLGTTMFRMRFVQTMLAVALAVGLTSRRYRIQNSPGRGDLACAAAFILSYACFCFELLLRPHLGGYEGSFLSVFLSPSRDLFIVPHFFLIDLIIVPIGLFVFFGTRVLSPRNDSIKNPWFAIIFGFGSSFAFLTADVHALSGLSHFTRSLSVPGGWVIYVAINCSLAFCTSWLGSQLCALASKAWKNQ